MKLQLQWVTQAQFAGYYAARRPGLLQGRGPRRHRSSRAASTSCRRRARAGRRRLRDLVGAEGARSREQGANDHRRRRRSSSAPAPCRSRSRTRTSPRPADLKGKKVGNWGFGNEFELFAGMTKAGLDPAKDVTLVQQQFDMNGFLAGDIDAAAGDDLQRVRAGARGEEPRRPASCTSRRLQRHQLERRGHRHAPGRDLGQHRQAAATPTYQDHDDEVHQGLHQGLDLLPRQRREVPRRSSSKPARSSARATSSGRSTRSTS